jgi:O-antigen/teichoic acid export membrane protein
MLKNSLAVLLGVVFICYGMEALGIVLGITIASLAAGCFSCIWFVKKYTLKYDFSTLKKMLKYGLPMAPAAIALLFLNSTDRYLLKYWDGLDIVGYYAFAYTIAIAISQITITPFTQIWAPTMWHMRYTANEKIFHQRVMTYYMLVQIAVLSVVILYSDTIIKLMTHGNVEYARVSMVVPIIYAACIFHGAYDITSAGLFITGKTHYYTFIAIIICLTNIVLNIIFISSFGVWACAIIYALSYLFFLLLTYYFGRKCFMINYEWKRLSILWLIGVGISLFGYVVKGEYGWYGLILASVTFVSLPAWLYILSFFTKEEKRYVKTVLQRWYQRYRYGMKSYAN